MIIVRATVVKKNLRRSGTCRALRTNSGSSAVRTNSGFSLKTNFPRGLFHTCSGQSAAQSGPDYDCPAGWTKNSAGCQKQVGYVKGDTCPEGWTLNAEKTACTKSAGAISIANPDDKKVITVVADPEKGIGIGGKVGIALGVVVPILSTMYCLYNKYKQAKRNSFVTGGPSVRAGMVGMAAQEGRNYAMQAAGVPTIPRNAAGMAGMAAGEGRSHAIKYMAQTTLGNQQHTIMRV